MAKVFVVGNTQLCLFVLEGWVSCDVNANARVVVEAQFSRIYGQAGIAYGFFEQLPQAYAWLAEQGFEPLAV